MEKEAVFVLDPWPDSRVALYRALQARYDLELSCDGLRTLERLVLGRYRAIVLPERAPAGEAPVAIDGRTLAESLVRLRSDYADRILLVSSEGEPVEGAWCGVHAPIGDAAGDARILAAIEAVLEAATEPIF